MAPAIGPAHMVYIDYNATTPCSESVWEAMVPYFFQKFGNAASRSHAYGWVADEAVKRARAQVAACIGASDQEIVFTSGATESCNLAIKGVFERYRDKGRHIVTCGTEHLAVLDVCRSLERHGAEITLLSVDETGMIDLDELAGALRDDTILIALMYANNETGTIHPVSLIGQMAKERNVLFFCDATQAVGKISVDVQRDHIDLMAMSAHKIYGPKGVGALYVRRKGPRVSLVPQIEGGGHERGMRSGTLNVPGIVGLGMACEESMGIMEEESLRLSTLRDRLEKYFLDKGGRANGATTQRLPHVANISVPGIKSEKWLATLNGQVAFSTGSACSSASPLPSHVLTCMGLEEQRVLQAMRFSLGRYTGGEEVDKAIAYFDAAHAAIKGRP